MSNEINGIIAEIHKRLTGGKESLKIIYEPSTGTVIEQALEPVQRERSEDEEYNGRAAQGRHLLSDR